MATMAIISVLGILLSDVLLSTTLDAVSLASVNELGGFGGVVLLSFGYFEISGLGAMVNDDI